MSINREFGGTGLGLAITKKLVDALEGRINFESKYGAGSTVTIDVPYEKSHQKIRHFDTMMTIAIMTHQMDKYRSFYKQLRKMGVTLRTLTTIDQLHREDVIDYVLIDWQQRFSDHNTLIQLLRERLKPDTPIDIISYERHRQVQKFIEEHDKVRVLLLPKNSEGVVKHVNAGQSLEHVYTLEESYNMNSIHNKRVLVVEDNHLNQDIERSILEEKGGIVTIASNGQEAIDFIETMDYDLILMDIHMPVMGGYEATRTIRAMDKGKSIPIIAMTADVQIEVAQKVKESGMNDYIKKPIDVMEVYKVLAKYL